MIMPDEVRPIILIFPSLFKSFLDDCTIERCVMLWIPIADELPLTVFTSCSFNISAFGGNTFYNKLLFGDCNLT